MRQYVLGVFAKIRCAAARLNSQGIARERTAWIRDRTANLRMLDRAPIVALPGMRDVVILFGGVNQPPRDVVRLRAMGAFFAIAGGEQTPDGLTYAVSRPVFRHTKRLVLVLR